MIDWLLEGDPAIRWQVLRDLTDAPADDVAAERARVEYDGWGARPHTEYTLPAAREYRYKFRMEPVAPAAGRAK